MKRAVALCAVCMMLIMMRLSVLQGQAMPAAMPEEAMAAHLPIFANEPTEVYYFLPYHVSEEKQKEIKEDEASGQFWLKATSISFLPNGVMAFELTETQKTDLLAYLRADIEKWTKWLADEYAMESLYSEERAVLTFYVDEMYCDAREFLVHQDYSFIACISQQTNDDGSLAVALEYVDKNTNEQIFYVDSIGEHVLWDNGDYSKTLEVRLDGELSWNTKWKVQDTKNVE